MKKEDKIVVESAPADKNSIVKLLITILIIVLLLAIFIVVFFNVRDYIKANRNETNFTDTNTSRNTTPINPVINNTPTNLTNTTRNTTNPDDNPPDDTSCTPNCAGKQCGGDGCGGTCSPGCSSGYECNSTGNCVQLINCTDTCTSLGYQCGNQQVCSQTTNCGTCTSGTCNSTGQCQQQSCTPNCVGKQCGGDGCGGSCLPGCSEGYYCDSGACKQGKVYYCDPVNGNTATGDGSAQKPWGSLESVALARKFKDVIKDGDIIRLKSGFHGSFDTRIMKNMTERNRSNYIVIEADEGAKPKISWIWMTGCSYWKFKNIDFSPSFNSSLIINRDPKGGSAILGSTSGSGNNHFIIENCRIFTVEDASSWTAYDWTAKTWGGIKLADTNSIYRNNTIFNVNLGISAGGLGLVEKNIIENYSCDGMFVGGENLIIQDNKIIDVYNTDAQAYVDFGRNASDKCHADAIQGGDPNMPNVTIRRNYITARTNPSRPASSVGGLQGIFLENSYLSGIIENNIVLAINSAHGITTGETVTHDTVENLIIRHNTISNPYGLGDNHPNIHFQGAKRSNITIVNNIAGAVPNSNETLNIIVSNNANLGSFNPETEFVNYYFGDMHLASGSHFINNGTTTSASKEDFDRKMRDATPDVGAYEYFGAAQPKMQSEDSLGEIRQTNPEPASEFSIWSFIKGIFTGKIIKDITGYFFKS